MTISIKKHRRGFNSLHIYTFGICVNNIHACLRETFPQQGH